MYGAKTLIVMNGDQSLILTSKSFLGFIGTALREYYRPDIINVS